MADVRWDNALRILIALFPLVVATIVAWFFLGDAAGGLVRMLATAGATAFVAIFLFCVRMLLLPPKIAMEARADFDSAIAELERQVAAGKTKCDELETELSSYKRPPAPTRNPNGIFQTGKEVAIVGKALLNEREGQIGFETMHAGPLFNHRNEFEYREFVLRLDNFQSSIGIGFGVASGPVTATLYGVTCTIVGSR